MLLIQQKNKIKIVKTNQKNKSILYFNRILTI